MPVMQTRTMVSTTPQMINVGMRKHFLLHILSIRFCVSRSGKLSIDCYCSFSICFCVSLFTNLLFDWHFSTLCLVFFLDSFFYCACTALSTAGLAAALTMIVANGFGSARPLTLLLPLLLPLPLPVLPLPILPLPSPLPLLCPSAALRCWNSNAAAAALLHSAHWAPWLACSLSHSLTYCLSLSLSSLSLCGVCVRALACSLSAAAGAAAAAASAAGSPWRRRRCCCRRSCALRQANLHDVFFLNCCCFWFAFFSLRCWCCSSSSRCCFSSRCWFYLILYLAFAARCCCCLLLCLYFCSFTFKYY